MQIHRITCQIVVARTPKTIVKDQSNPAAWLPHLEVVHVMPRFLLIGLLRPQMGHRAGCHLNAPHDAFNLRVLNKLDGRRGPGSQV